MPLLTLEQASLAFGHHPLLDNADFQLDPAERVGLIGRNGTGKSSLMKIMAGLGKLDDGRLWVASDARLAYVSQEPQFEPEHTVFEAVAGGLGGLHKLLLDYHHCTAQMAEPDADIDALLDTMQELQNQLEARDGWRFNSLVESTLSNLDLNPDVLIKELSGGWKKRVALARALVSEPEILLLDEPTNHLDVAAIEWLETMLKGFSGSVIVITHDRRFLDNIATRIVELDRGALVSFPGNFAAYQIKKAEMLEVERIHSRQFDKFWAQEEVWIRKGVEARRTRNEGRVRRLEALRVERAARRERMGQVNFTLDAGERSGKLVAELENVSKSYGGRKLISNFTTRIMRGDRIGLLGPNGAGKTTLLKLILGEIEPDTGTVKQGTKLDIAYFDQFREQLDEESAIVDIISQGNEFIDIGGSRKHVISYLEDFLFAPERARSPVKSLSGGERNRLLLARLFTKPVNVLVLDEPTNDLDIDTLELLEQLLADYKGTVFLVSHDRAFLDNVVTQVIAFEGDGVLREYAGGYDDWMAARARAGAGKVSSEARPAGSASAAAAPAAQPKDRGGKLSFNENRELQALPAEIEVLEQEQEALSNELLDPEVYKQGPAQMKQRQTRLDAIDELLIGKLARWEELEKKLKG